ncbi:hypothetical protein [Natrinema halophilum]|uniref:hypothetical protein n=1 Tax=Natrinema halophilum TaxID=1699371 RepID=UPI0031BA433A
MAIVGLGWRRASHTATITGLARSEEQLELSMNVLTLTQEPAEEVLNIGEEEPEEVVDADDLGGPGRLLGSARSGSSARLRRPDWRTCSVCSCRSEMTTVAGNRRAPSRCT